MKIEFDRKVVHGVRPRDLTRALVGGEVVAYREGAGQWRGSNGAILLAGTLLEEVKHAARNARRLEVLSRGPGTVPRDR